MNLNVHTQGIALTRKIDGEVRARLTAALRRYTDRVIGVDVYLKDINGPKGGNDKSVVVKAQLRGRLQVAVTVLRADLFSAIGVAARRVQRQAKRATRKQRGFERKTLRHLGPVNT